MKSKWGVGLCLVWIFSQPGLADVGGGNLEFGFDSGFIFLGTGAFESNIDAGGRVALRGGFHLTDHLEIEGQYSFSKSEGDCGLTSCEDVDTTLRTFFVNGVFNFKPIETNDPEVKAVPYVLIGVGDSYLGFDGDISDEDVSRAYQVGTGVRLYVNRFGIRGELLVIQDHTFDERSTHFTLGAGMTFALGSVN